MKICFLIFLLPAMFISGTQTRKDRPSISLEVVNLVKKHVTCQWNEKTVDTFKSGNPDSPLKGIAVCMFADMYILQEAVKNKCNLIITHEPVFYNHADDISFLVNNKVYQAKQKFIDDNGLVIWRFHDHWHKTSPDGIYMGMVLKLGWEKYNTDTALTRFALPEISLSELSGEISRKLGIKSVRIIGDPEMKVRRIGFLAGAPGSRSQIEILNEENIDVLIGGEVPEWETYIYVKDAVALGMNKGAIFLGHIKSEEEGMAYCAEWLKTFIEGVPVIFIPNKPNFEVK